MKLSLIRSMTRSAVFECGHYHDNKAITIKDIVLYEQIVRIA